MLKITKEFVTDNCSPNNPPAARCHSGDTVVFETRDCYDDRLHGDGSVTEPEKALENPATGPLYIEEGPYRPHHHQSHRSDAGQHLRRRL